MRLGAISTVFVNDSLEVACRKMQTLGVECIEIGTGGHFPKNHCHPAKLLSEPAALEGFVRAIADAKLTISALAIHGEPLHPDPKIAGAYDADFRATCALAKRIGVTRLTLLAGLPEGAPGDKTPNWTLYPFPPRNLDIYKWQWEQRLIPYWKEHGKIAADHGIRLCFEMHPADMVFKPEELLRLRDAVGPVIGCNLDPSHLFWQGMDISAVIRQLGNAIYHSHAKDSLVNPHVARVNGVLDAKDFRVLDQRSWLFRTVGYGHSEDFWRGYVCDLRLAGYDDVMSIEHEDPLIDPEEGFELAVGLLKKVLVRKAAGGVWFEAAGSESA